MIIACDVDDVVANLRAEWLSRYNRDWNDNLTEERITTWDFHTLVDPLCGKGIYEYLHAPDLYEHVQPIAGAVEGIDALRAAGHRILFVTNNVWGMTDQKAAWLIRHGFIHHHGRMLPSDLIVTGEKTLVGANLLIDDAGKTIRDWVQVTRRRAILFEYSHNRYLLEEMHSAFWLMCQRVTRWREILPLVELMEAKP